MEDRLVVLLEAYRKIEAKQTEACETIDMQLADLQAKRWLLSSPLQEKLDKVAHAIEKEMLKLDKPYVHPVYGKVGYRHGYVRVTWDGLGLDNLAETNKRLWNQIREYRRETEVAPSVKVEPKDKGGK